MSADDTIFALSSGRPPAAIAVIRVSGPQAHAAGTALARSLPDAGKTYLRRLFYDDALLDEALILRFNSPASATGEDVVEFQCHGGRAIVDAVLGALARQPGLRPAEPGEFTRRALANGRIGLTEAEGLADLLEAETEIQRRAALLLAEGGLARPVETWRERLLALSAQAEAAIDYVGDEDETAADPGALVAEAEALVAEWTEWLDRPRAEPLREGIRVVAAGPPNAGKSSLINALSRSERAIVTDLPGTTRDVIEVPLALEGIPFVLVDTAGLRDSDNRVEAIGVARAGAEVARADILLWLGEPSDSPAHARLIQLYPRADLPDRSRAPAGTLAVSTRTGLGLDDLMLLLISQGRSMIPSDGQLALNRRQASELATARAALMDVPHDGLLVAEAARQALRAFDRLTGRSCVEDMLDSLFGRFCLGK